MPVVVESPQFHSTDTFQLSMDPAPTLQPSMEGRTPSGFIRFAVEVALLAAWGHVGYDALKRLLAPGLHDGRPLHILVRADNDFYSQTEQCDIGCSQLRRRDLPVSLESLAGLPRFLPNPTDETGRPLIAKTGLGSSAALTTSLVGCLLAFFGVASLPGGPLRPGSVSDVSARHLVHHVSQVAHGLAQGKVGSGFDVAAATFGSIRYVRVARETAEAWMNRLLAVQAGEEEPAVVAQSVAASAETPWDCEITPFSLPRGIDLMIGDVCGGSETPSMVRKVLSWKRDGGARAASLWQQIADHNESIERRFLRLRSLASEDPCGYDAAIHACSATVASSWAADGGPVGSELGALRSALTEARRDLKMMGEQAGVPIEPDSQTRLADATASCEGVISAGVPGAGGFDAIFALFLRPSEALSATAATPRSRIAQLWLEWPLEHGSVCPLLLSAGGAAGVDGSDGGIRLEPDL